MNHFIEFRSLNLKPDKRSRIPVTSATLGCEAILALMENWTDIVQELRK